MSVADSDEVQGTTMWDRAPFAELSRIKGVALDIDETLSTRGKLTAGAYASLWALKDAGFAVVPITGRPAGWCDHIARFWPVDAVVGENGAFTQFMLKGALRRVDTPSGFGVEAGRARLEALKNAIRTRFPLVKWASDQPFRQFDVAVDVYEDVKPWSEEDVQELLSLCRREGAHAKLSSVHVNAWFGDYDKNKGFRHWLASGAAGLAAGKTPTESEWLFIGDSPNDEPMFQSFAQAGSTTVGVANLKAFASQLQYPPRYLTSAESGAGFSEMAARLIAVRAKG